MRRRLGIETGDVLTTIKGWTSERQAWANAILADIEEEAMRNMKLMPGTAELLAFLDGRRLPRGLVTRNVKTSVDYFHAHCLPRPLAPFSPALSRDCGFPHKPAPDSLLHICAAWNVAPAEVLCIGDSAKDDVAMGNRAGCITVLLDYQQQDHGREVRWRALGQTLEGEMRPHHIVGSLTEVVELLESSYTVECASSPRAVAAAAAGQHAS